MHRNLDRRVEVLTPVSDPAARAHLSRTLVAAFDDETAGWDLQPDGTWMRSGGIVDYQELLMKSLADRGE
jgi:polyphosphate kinase